MKYFDESGRELTEDDIDLNLGSLSYEQRVTGHVEASPEQPEMAEWVLSETIPDAYIKVIQTPYKPAVEAHDVIETVGIYHVYTDEELAEQAEKNAKNRISTESQLVNALPVLVGFHATEIPSDMALDFPLAYPEWTEGGKYKKGDVFRVGNHLYRCVKNDNNNDVPPCESERWVEEGTPDENGVFPWRQPSGKKDAYRKGDKRTYDGKTWESLVNHNYWVPGEYGWEQVQ